MYQEKEKNPKRGENDPYLKKLLSKENFLLLKSCFRLYERDLERRPEKADPERRITPSGHHPVRSRIRDAPSRLSAGRRRLAHGQRRGARNLLHGGKA